MHVPDHAKSAIKVAINPDTDTFWKADYLYYDQYTLKEMEVRHSYGKLKNASMADKITRMNYDIHIGAIAGLPGKILAFLASLIAASLPITGFLIWRGRKKKKASQE
ncbi:PepSY domain-containing protein [Pedobacter sp. N36a]|uniref:PepSY domain-containing protein n=1 Tax=Pedobacter sp. N36a TaxID=2767996 RepID=UPI001656D259|nr:PepSY domain-containing protein [Pedobacter sp. N36a]